MGCGGGGGGRGCRVVELERRQVGHFAESGVMLAGAYGLPLESSFGSPAL